MRHAARAVPFASVFALVLPLTVATGCNKLRDKLIEKASEKATEKALEQQTGAKVDIEKGGNEIKIEGAAGKAVMQTGASVKLPDDFPKVVPVYPGAKLTAAMTNDKDGKKAHVLMFQTPDKADAVAGFYKSNMKGFKQPVDLNTGMQHMMTFNESPAKLDVALMISGEGNETSVQLTAVPSGK